MTIDPERGRADDARASSIAVALSGGGHRAALFGLGVLFYLVDAGKNREVTSIASVSGASLTNGVLAQAGDFQSMTPEQFVAVADEFRTTISDKGTLWASPFTKAYGLLLLLALAAPIAVWFLPVSGWLRLILFVVLLLLLGFLAQLRGIVGGRAFASALYSPRGRPTKLSEIATGLDHVFCATDLHAGEHVYFSGRFVCSYRFGFGQPGDVPLHTVVQASAAYPGGFPPRWLPTARHRFQEAQDEKARSTRAMALVDGGVYDNLADQWGFGVERRNVRWKTLNPGLREPDELIVVNSSAPMRFGPLSKLRLPLLGELFTFLRDVNVLYDNTTTPRRRLLHSSFVTAMRSGRGLSGAIVQISQSPFDVALGFAGGATEDAPAVRARCVLAALGDARDEWDAITEANSNVKTTLSRIPTPDAKRLVLHGYVLAMANLCVLLGYPLRPIPSSEFLESGERTEL